MPRGRQNRLPVRVKQSYFELIRTGMPGAEAARRVGVSMSCGSLWFIDAGSVSITETRPISSRYINQDDRIEIADGLAAGEPVKSIAARIGKSFQSLYREIARNSKPDGTYQPWFAHNQAYLRRRRPRRRILAQETSLAAIIAGKLARRWSPEQISRWLRRRYRRRLAWHVCPETGSLRIQSAHSSASPVKPVMRSRSARAVTASRGLFDAMRPNLLPSAVLASGLRNANG